MTAKPALSPRRALTLLAFAALSATPAHHAAAQTTVEGGQTLNISSDTAYSTGLIVGNTSTGTVNQSAGTVTVSSTFTLGNQASGSGAYNLSGGTLNYSGQLNVGSTGQGLFTQTGNSTVNVTTLNLQTGTNSNYTLAGGALNVSSLFSVKVGNTYTQTGGAATLGGTFRVYGTSVANISGGSLTANSANAIGNTIGNFAGANTSGTLNLSGTGAVAFNNAVITLGYGATGVVNQSGTSTLTAAKGVVLGTQVIQGNTTYNGSATYNLDGGTLTTTSITPGASSSNATLNLNGGTLAASAASTAFVSGLTVANVRNGGALINSNGFDVTVPQALVHSTVSGDNATDGGLTKLGAGTLTLTGANTYTGATTVNAGTLAVGTGGSLYNGGTAAESVVINNGGLLRLDHNDTFGDASAKTPVSFTVNAGGRLAGNGSFNTLNAVTLNGGTIEANAASNTSTTGAFGFAGTITATGTTASNITAGGVNDGNYIRLGANGASGTTNSATFNVSDAAGRLNVAVPLTDNFNSTGGLTKTGAGTLALAGANTYTGPTAVNAGTLAVNGSTAASSAVTVNSGATLGGSGTVAGPVTVNGGATLAPGNSPGRLTLGGSLTLGAGATLAIELGGTLADGAANQQYDQVFLAGALTLGGNLSVVAVNGFTLLPGQTFVLLDQTNATALPVTTFFANAPGGIYTDAAGDRFTVNYAANADGGTLPNDVTLTVLPVAVPEPTTWALLLTAGAGLLGGAARRHRAARLRV